MKKVVIKFGIYGLIVGLIVFLIAVTYGKELDFSTQEVIGYITIIASLSFVYFGIRYYRDHENNGQVSFRKALILGLLISAFTAAGIAVADFIYTSSINPDFFEEYAAMMRAEGYKGEIPDYGNGFMALIMFLTVMVVGLIISIISGLFLKTK